MPSKNEVYESIIRPAIEEVYRLCDEHDVDFVACCATPSVNDPYLHSTSVRLTKVGDERSKLLTMFATAIFTGVSRQQLQAMFASGEVRDPNQPDNVVRMVPPLRVI